VSGDEATATLLALTALGAFHGANPAMGWLFAVALGLQQQRRAAVWRALAALGLGHALAIGAAMAAGAVVFDLVSPQAVRTAVAVCLLTLGLVRLVRSRHPRVGGSMQIGFAGVAAWSFLVASAHGAGLMVLPFVLGSGAGSVHAQHHAAGPPDAQSLSVLAALAAHSAGYLLAAVAIAWLVYERLGVHVLRRAWINLDAIWAIALLATGAAALFTL
jgi:hypothetical protein